MRGRAGISTYKGVSQLLVMAFVGMMVLLATSSGANLQAQTAEEQAAVEIETFQMGVLATEGATRVLEAWQPTVDLLNYQAEAQELPYRFGLQPETHNSLGRIRRGG